jgi:nicotinate-nucleotide adenylyltransferase
MSSPEDRRERLGILGGTFDPPHLGHLAAATACFQALSLDRILFVVAHDPWQKSPLREIAPASDRLAMVDLATRGTAGVEVSRIELDRGGPSYTVETVEALVHAARERGSPPPEVVLIVGADVVGTLSTWHRSEDLRAMVTLAVVARPGAELAARIGGWRVEMVEGSRLDVSSSEIRALVAAGRPITGMVDEAVEQYIERHGLYAVRR